MVTIARFDFLPQAEIVRGRLLAEGIDCRLADQHLVQTDWLYSLAVGGIKLQVETKDVERALAILERDYSADLDAESDEST
ncbi:MAG: DUF2007 domain-containing protein [Candidatus Competibacteraceae bacterium]